MYEKNIYFERMNPQQIREAFKPFNGTVDANLVNKLSRGIVFASDHSKPMFSKNLNALYAKATLQTALTETPFLPLPENIKGDIVLGTLVQGNKDFGVCRLPISELVHCFITGFSGTGKSTLVWSILKQLLEKKSRLLVFDRKRDIRNITTSVPMVILNANDLRINIFDPPTSNINPRAWISKVCDLFTIFGLYYSSRNYIKEFVITLLEETKQTPTIFDVYYSIKSKTERGQTRANYHDASLNKIQNIVEELGPFFSCKKSFPLEQLLDIPIAIEVDQLSMQSERFLVAFFLLAIIEMRKAKSIRGNPAIDEDSIFVFIDEAANLWNPQLDSSERVQEMSFDILQEIPLIARDFKVCLFFSSQRPLSKNIMANVRTKLLSNMPDAEDAWYMANSIGTKPDIFQKLGVGEFLVKTGKTDPFLIRTEKIERQILDDKSFDEMKKPFAEHIMLNCTPLTEQMTIEKSEDVTRLDSDSKKFLINVVNYPSLTVTQRYDELFLKGRYAQDLKQSLIERRMIEEIFLAIGSSKQSTFLVPTQKTIDYLDSIGISARFYKHIGKTSPMHQLIQAMIIEYFTDKNCIVQNDCQIGQKFVDVYIESNKKVAFEVAVNPAIEAERVSSALDFVDHFVILAADLMILKSIENSLKSLKSEKIKIFLASFFLAGLKKGTLDIISLNILEQQNSQNKQNSTSHENEQQENRSNQQVG